MLARCGSGVGCPLGLRRARARRCYSGWRRPLQEGPLPALPAPSLARADADVGAGSWRDALISAGRLLGAGAPRYLPSGTGAGASRAGCMLQRETPGSQGDWECQAKAASAALCGQRVTGGSPRPPRIRVREEHHPPFLPWVLPQAWIRERCARSGSVRQSPGSGREAPRAPAPTPKPHTHKPPFPRHEGLPPPRPGPLWTGTCV